MSYRGRRLREAQRQPFGALRVVLLIAAVLFAGAGVGLYLWRGRPMLFGTIICFCGALWCLLWVIFNRRAVHGVLIGLLGAGLVSFGLLEGMVIASETNELRDDPDAIVVLGAAVWEDGPSPLMVTRLQTAYDYWTEHPDLTVVVTGGQGVNEPETEADAMTEWLLAQGVPENKILQEENAANTAENLRFSAELLEQCGIETDNLVIVSNRFHLCRVRMLAERQGLEVSTIGADSTDIRSTVYFTARESLALVKSWLLDREIDN